MTIVKILEIDSSQERKLTYACSTAGKKKIEANLLKYRNYAEKFATVDLHRIYTRGSVVSCYL